MKSSVYDNIVIFKGGDSRLCIKRLKREGESTEPCGRDFIWEKTVAGFKAYV